MEQGNSGSQLYLAKRNTLYIGRLPDGLNVCQGCAGLVFGLEAELKVSCPDVAESVSLTSVLVPADSKTRISSQGKLLAVYLFDYLGEDLSSHKPLMTECFELDPDTVFFGNHRHETQLMELVKEIYNDCPDAKDAFHKVYQSGFYRKAHEDFSIDPRIAEAVRLIRFGNALDWTIEEVASSVNLSVPRLTQLFRQQVGINIRRFKLWQRVFLTSVYCAQGMALTDASIRAGFSDYAHFSRTYTEMLGVNPSIVLSPKFNGYISVCDVDIENQEEHVA